MLYAVTSAQLPIVAATQHNYTMSCLVRSHLLPDSCTGHSGPALAFALVASGAAQMAFYELA